MSNQTQRSQAYQTALARFLCEAYRQKVISIAPARRGFYGETWRVETPENRYFAKLVYFPEYQPVYARSFPVVDYLRSHGIDFISTVVKTADGQLFTRFDGAILGLFDWIDGENRETDDTKLWEYQLLAKVYAVPLKGIAIPAEDFSGRSADAFFRQWNAATDRALLALLEEHRSKLTYRARRLAHFAALCQKDTSAFVLTHGDAGGNFFTNGSRHYLIDWDDALLAPPERDAWVMGYQTWARDLFEASLRQNGIHYALRPERLAYYCYFMFFFWPTWLTRCADAAAVNNFFAGYGDQRIEYADELWRSTAPNPLMGEGI